MRTRSWMGGLAAVVLAVGLSVATDARAELRLAAVFGDHMVLQCEKPVPVWGWADAGAEVKIAFAGQSKTAKADAQGFWMTCLDPMKPSCEPRELKAEGGATVVVKDVLVGEVWLCSGQSNMAFPLRNASTSAEALAGAADPMIRLLKVEMPPRDSLVSDPTNAFKGAWAVSSAEAAGPFPAVGFFFGRELRRARNVPIGLIGSAVGGTAAQLWTDRASIDALPELQVLFEEQNKAEAAYDPAAAEEAHKRNLARHKEASARAKSDGKAQPSAPRKSDNPRNKRPCKLYNTMIAPLQPYAIRGAIWYQGEANSSKAAQYEVLLPAMIQGWRRTWGTPPALGSACPALPKDDFPFLFVQLPGYNAEHWPLMRESMAKLWKKTSNTGMAVAIDVGDPKNIHPTNKQPVGERLARIARGMVYGEKIDYIGPTFARAEFKDGAAVVSFDHLGGGLEAKDGKVTGFALAGADRKFVDAEASIDGSRVVVKSAAVPSPASVRYAWAAFPAVSLFSKEGLPVAPFRSDDWPVETPTNAPRARR